jgi:hypothetical protein
VFDASGLASSPIGFSSYTMLTLDEPGYDSQRLDYDDAAVSLTSGTGLASSPVGFRSDALGQTLSHGGWTVGAGYGGATVLVGSGAAAVGLDAQGDSVAAGHWAVPLQHGRF